MDSLTSDGIASLVCPLRVNSATVAVSPQASSDWGYRCADRSDLSTFYLFWGDEGFVELEGQARVRCRDGDAVMLPKTIPHILGGAGATSYDPLDFSEIGLPTQSLRYTFQPATVDDEGHVRKASTYRNVAYARGVTMMFMSLDQVSARALLRQLPELVHVRLAKNPALEWMGNLAALMRSENAYARLGRAAVMQRLNELFVAECVLEFFAQRDETLASRKALHHPKLNALIGDMHRAPDRFARSISKLAASVHMSRSTFVSGFTEITGSSPISYLRELQMRRAAELIDAGVPWAEVMGRFGYKSDLAFQRAFRKVVGISPAALRRGG